MNREWLIEITVDAHVADNPWTLAVRTPEFQDITHHASENACIDEIPHAILRVQFDAAVWGD